MGVFWNSCRIASFALLLASSSAAHALDLSVTARAEAGLDPATRNFIATLPATWRPQLAGIVDDTINRVDVSFASYVQQIDKLVSNQIIDVQCHVLATEKGAVDDIVRRFPWVSPGGPLEKLRDQIAKDDRRRKADSSPTFIKTLYDDRTIAASVVACQAGGVATAVNDAKKIMTEYSNRWLVWNRIEELNCATSMECIAGYRLEFGEILRKADPRDVKASGAKATFDAIKIPDTSSWWFGGSQNFDQIESNLTKLFNAENALGGAKAVRETLAVNKLNHAGASTSDAAKQVDAGFSSIKTNLMAPPTLFFGGVQGFRLGPNPLHFSCEQAFAASNQYLTTAKGMLDSAVKELNEASALASIIQPEVDIELAKVTSQRNRTTDAATFCKGPG